MHSNKQKEDIKFFSLPIGYKVVADENKQEDSQR